jgi:hypothetical protein
VIENADDPYDMIISLLYDAKSTLNDCEHVYITHFVKMFKATGDEI